MIHLALENERRQFLGAARMMHGDSGNAASIESQGHAGGHPRNARGPTPTPVHQVCIVLAAAMPASAPHPA